METNLIYLITSGVVALLNITIVLIASRKKKTSTNEEEKQKMDDIINDQFNMAITNIKSLCNTNNLMYNAKQTTKIAKKIIKENTTNGK